nr:bromodomain-containing protein 3-like [Dermacentor andersoni]
MTNASVSSARVRPLPVPPPAAVPPTRVRPVPVAPPPVSLVRIFPVPPPPESSAAQPPASSAKTRTVFGIPPPGRRSVASAKPPEAKKTEQEVRRQQVPSRHNDQAKNGRKPVTKFIGSCKDIDSLLKYGSDEEPETFEQFEDQFEKGVAKKSSPLPMQSKKHSPGDRVKHFIGKFQDIDDMLGAAAMPVFPLSPSDRSPFERSFADSWAKKPQQEDSDSSGDSSLEEVKVSSVKVHESKQAIRPRLDAYTEEIDSSAVRIREPKVMQGQITKRPTRKVRSTYLT